MAPTNFGSGTSFLQELATGVSKLAKGRALGSEKDSRFWGTVAAVCSCGTQPSLMVTRLFFLTCESTGASWLGVAALNLHYYRLERNIDHVQKERIRQRSSFGSKASEYSWVVFVLSSSFILAYMVGRSRGYTAHLTRNRQQLSELMESNSSKDQTF